MSLRNRFGRTPTTCLLNRRQFLGFGAALLFVGWLATELVVARPGAVPGDPGVAITAVWLGLFALTGVVGLTQCPDYVRFSRPLVVWGALNAAAFAYTGAAVLGLLPPALVVYGFWHVWVGAAVVGFAATGALLERSGSSGQHYFTAAGLEVSLLFIGLGTFEAIVPGLYFLLALVHPTPLALDALPGDIGPGPAAALQLALYAVGLGLVLVV